MASTIKSPDEIKSVPNLFKDVSFYLIDESKEEVRFLLMTQENFMAYRRVTGQISGDPGEVRGQNR